MTTIEVAVDCGATVEVGTANVRRRQGVDITEFVYDAGFLAADPWEISPDLPLIRGTAVSEGLPGALLDSAPDAWGRNLITRRRATDQREAGPSGPPTEVDFLLGVDDLTRQGALRFRIDGGPFLAEHADVPHLIELSELMAAARAVSKNAADTDAIATLLAAGSGSLGGARPKVSVIDDAQLLIAKFTHPSDDWSVIRWEATALDLAAALGLRTSQHELIEVDGEPVLLVRRFDRDDGRRVAYLSARSLIAASTNGVHDYLELVEGVADHGSAVDADLEELWRRIAFSIAINNIDDHLRNHGFLRNAGGWTLSPLFDVNPDQRALPRTTSIAGATTFGDSVDALNASSASFGIEAGRVAALWSDIAGVVAGWREAADRNGIGSTEQDVFARTLDRVGKQR